MAHTHDLFRHKTKQFKLNLKEHIKEDMKVVSAVQDKESVIVILRSMSEEKTTFYVFNQYKCSSLQLKQNHGLTQIHPINETTLIFFVGKTYSFSVLNAHSMQINEINLGRQSQWQNSDFQLQYFKQTSLLCLIEKNKAENKLKILYLRYEEGRIVPIHQFTTEEGQWKEDAVLFKTDQNSSLAWCLVSDQQISLNTYCLELEFVSLGPFAHTFGTSVKIAFIWSHADSFHLVFQNQDIPVYIVQTQKRRQVKEFRPSRRQVRHPIKSFLPIHNFLLLSLQNQEQHSVIIYDLYNESIKESIGVQNGVFTDSFKTEEFVVSNYDKDSGDLDGALINTAWRPLSSVTKVLEAVNMLNSNCQTVQNVILIFGAHLSGKTTLRHHLNGDQLEYHETEGHYYQVRAVNPDNDIDPEDPERSLVIRTSINQKAVIVQIPAWGQDIFIEAQIALFINQLFKTAKQMHTIVTIPEEDIADSERNIKTLVQMLKIIGKAEIDVSQAVSFCLTKAEGPEYVLQMFRERVEQIKQKLQDYIKETNQLDQKASAMINAICQSQRIYIFENKKFENQDEGKQLLETILKTDQLKITPKMADSAISLLQNETMSTPISWLFYQFRFGYFSFGCRLQSCCEQIIGPILKYNIQQGKQNYQQKYQPLIGPLFQILGTLKLFSQSTKKNDQEITTEFKESSQAFIEAYQKLFGENQSKTLKNDLESFTAMLAIHNVCLKRQKQHSSDLISSFLKSGLYNILTHKFLQIINSLLEKKNELSKLPLYKQLQPYLVKPKGPARIVTKTVAMKYAQQRASYTSKRNILEVICSLPANAMKLDLMIEQLLKIGPQEVSDDNMRQVRFYIRECSRVCQFHGLYLEALTFLMVLPDFLGIETLLDQLVAHHKNKSYEFKKIFQRTELDIFDELITICRTCVRDSLVKKLIHIKTLGEEVGSKKSSHKVIEAKLFNKELSKPDSYGNYIEKLKNNTDLPYFNLKNDTYKKMIDNSGELIQRCKEYEKDDHSKYIFQRNEGLNWLVQSLPIPSR